MTSLDTCHFLATDSQYFVIHSSACDVSKYARSAKYLNGKFRTVQTVQGRLLNWQYQVEEAVVTYLNQ
jgi:hypothetical protein